MSRENRIIQAKSLHSIRSKALFILLFFAAGRSAIQVHAQNAGESQGTNWQQQMQANYVPMVANSGQPAVADQEQPGASTAQPLAGMNENASSMYFEDREVGHVNAGLDFTGAWSDNLFNNPSSSVSGAYFGIGTPVGLRLQSQQTKFAMDFRTNTILYTGFSGLKFTSYTFSQDLQHQSSEATSFDWAVAAGRTASVGEYLPSFIGIGSTGVTQSAVSADVAQSSYTISNAATTFSVKHALTERDSIVASIVAGWAEDAPKVESVSSSLRDQLGGATLQWSRAMTQRSTIGLELNEVYIRGLTPAGHAGFSALKGTYGFQFNPHTSVTASAGPLYNAISSAGLQGASGLNYAASAGLGYTARSSKINLGYARVYELGYLSSALLAHQFSVDLDQRISRTRDLTVGTRYVRSSGNSAAVEQSSFGISGRFDQKLLSRLDLFLSADRMQQEGAPVVGGYPSFNRDDFTAGIAVVLDRPATSLGER